MPPIPATRLNCKNLAELDNGALGLLVDDAIGKISADIEDRGHDGQPRKLTIEIEFSRDMKRGPNEHAVQIDPKVSIKLPSYRAGLTNAKFAPAATDGEFGLLFRANNAENADQGTIYDQEPEEKAK